MKKQLLLTLIVTGSILIPACNLSEKASSKKAIAPPFENALIKFNEMDVNAEEGKNISLPNGTQIIIPASAFVDASGKMVKGKVTIKYREFHDAADIILSGIPMSYDSAGSKMNFQTAGMFEIKGYHKNQAIFISNEKSIEVKMGSYTGENNYNFYQLDSNSGSWTYKGNNTPTLNQDKINKMKEKLGTPVAQPFEPKEYDPKGFVFDLDINAGEYPELKDFKSIIWQYAGNNDSINPEKNQWMFSERWTSIKLTPHEADNSVFWLNLSNRKNSFKTIVRPVLTGKNLASARKKFKEKLAAYEAFLKAKALEEQRLANEASFVRSFQVSSFGIYNWDRVFKNPESIKMIADFAFDQSVDKGTVTIFLIANKTTVIRYPKYDWEKFNYLPSENNVIVAVMPGDKVAVFKDFASVPTTAQGEAYTFKLKTLEQTIKSPDDLRSVLELI